MNAITIKIPEYLHRQVEELSSSEGFSIDQFFVTAASEKLSVIRELDYVARRSSKANEEDFTEVLRSIPASAEVPVWDRMPPSITEKEHTESDG